MSPEIYPFWAGSSRLVIAKQSDHLLQQLPSGVPWPSQAQLCCCSNNLLVCYLAQIQPGLGCLGCMCCSDSYRCDTAYTCSRVLQHSSIYTYLLPIHSSASCPVKVMQPLNSRSYSGQKMSWSLMFTPHATHAAASYQAVLDLPLNYSFIVAAEQPTCNYLWSPAREKGRANLHCAHTWWLGGSCLGKACCLGSISCLTLFNAFS